MSSLSNIRSPEFALAEVMNSVNAGINQRLEQIEIPEDSIYRKILACIPLIGHFVAPINERFLVKKIDAMLMIEIENVHQIKYTHKLIMVKNSYKRCSIIRDFLYLATIIAGVALSIINVNVPGAIIFSTIAIGLIASNIYGLRHNQQAINKLYMNEASLISVL